jgi:WD40 repeat protein
VVGVAFSPDGRQVVSSGLDGLVLHWPAGAGAADLCEKLPFDISRQQWRDWVSPDITYISTCPQNRTATKDPS